MAPCEGVSLKTTSKLNHDLASPNGTVPRGEFKANPTYRNSFPKTPQKWLKGKKVDDDIGPYWRVHNKLYDLTNFIHRHPGGKDWIESTKGTDITEAFESSHVSFAAEKYLSEFFVKDINKPRNSPYTFHEDGFYRTLKKKVRPILQKTGRGPTWKMIFIQDGLLISFIILAMAASLTYSYTLAIVSGFILGMNMMCSHNFSHQRDNFRMYYFDLSLLSSYDWRINHGLSHHLFANTRYDVEVAALEPFLLFCPYPEKTLIQRYGFWVYEILVIPLYFYMTIIKKFFCLIKKDTYLRVESFLPLIEMLVMCGLAPTFGAGLKLWLALHAASSAWFGGVSLMLSHHHPEIYHEGDAFRENPDWGLCQLDAVRDRVEVKGNLFLISTTFGDHSLHHLFPSVDHSKLNDLYPAFFETCKEFNIPFEFLSQWDLCVGMYQQLANITPNISPPGYKNKQE